MRNSLLKITHVVINCEVKGENEQIIKDYYKDAKVKVNCDKYKVYPHEKVVNNNKEAIAAKYPIAERLNINPAKIYNTTEEIPK